MCLENRVLLREKLRGATCWAENFGVSVGVGLLLGRSGLPRSHENVDWGRPLRDNLCGLGNGPDRRKQQHELRMITKPRSLVLDIRFFPSLAHDRIDPLQFHISKVFQQKIMKWKLEKLLSILSLTSIWTRWLTWRKDYHTELHAKANNHFRPAKHTKSVSLTFFHLHCSELHSTAFYSKRQIAADSVDFFHESLLNSILKTGLKNKLVGNKPQTLGPRLREISFPGSLISPGGGKMRDPGNEVGEILGNGISNVKSLPTFWRYKWTSKFRSRFSDRKFLRWVRRTRVTNNWRKAKKKHLKIQFNKRKLNSLRALHFTNKGT